MEEVAVYISLKNSNSYVKNSIISLVKKYCNLKKYNYEIYLDEVENCLSLDRKELNRLMNDIKKHKYSKLIIRDVTHLSRNIYDNISFLQFLEDNNCKIECIDGTDLFLYKRIVEHFNRKKEEKIR